jgi:mRNA deadenylase 3'-5' endonuclease subunit Ccr4
MEYPWLFIHVVDDVDGDLLTLSFEVPGRASLRALRRKPHEIARKTAFRILKAFAVQDSPPCSIKVGGADQIDLDSVVARDAFAQGHTVVVARADGTCCARYRVVVNAPAVRELLCHGRATCGWPLLPLTTTRFAHGCEYCWTCGDVEVSHERMVMPRASTCGAGDLSVAATPFRDDVGVGRVYGVPVIFGCGPVSSAPSATPSDARAAAHRAGEGGSAAAARVVAGVIRFITYNILAPTYVQQSSAEDTPVYLSTAYRQQLLLSELSACDADLVALQECSPRMYNEYLAPHLDRLGFEGCYNRKASTTADGCALFWRRSALELVASEAVALRDAAAAGTRGGALVDAVAAATGLAAGAGVLRAPLAQSPSIVQLAVLRLLGVGGNIVCCNTHLYHHPNGEKVRTLQCALALDAAVAFARTHAPRTRGEGRVVRPALLFAGDLNATPETATIEYLCNAALSLSHQQWRGKDRGAVVFDEMEVEREQGRASVSASGTPSGCSRRHGNLPVLWTPREWTEEASASPLGGEEVALGAGDEAPALTHPFQFVPCHAISQDPSRYALTTLCATFDGTLDWCFIERSRLRFKRVWSGFSAADFPSDGIPSADFPSDHVAVVAEIAVLR